MERLAGRPESTGRQPVVAPEWSQYRRADRLLSREDKLRGAREGVWPEGTSPVFIDLYTKTSVEDRLLWTIFGPPSAEEIQEIRARTPEDLRRIEEERAEDDRRRLAVRVGEPVTTTLGREELQARYDQMFPGGITEEINKILLSLAPVETQVLRERFGLDDGRERTLREIGEEIGRSPRTVGRIEKRALGKLRGVGDTASIKQSMGAEEAEVERWFNSLPEVSPENEAAIKKIILDTLQNDRNQPQQENNEPNTNS